MSRSVRRRVRVLELRVGGTYPAELVAKLAQEAGCTEAELIDEAERLIAKFAKAGATTWEAQLRIVAEDRGIPVAELQAEIDLMKVDVR
jgi:hypothetical protein